MANMNFRGRREKREKDEIKGHWQHTITKR